MVEVGLKGWLLWALLLKLVSPRPYVHSGQGAAWQQ